MIRSWFAAVLMLAASAVPALAVDYVDGAPLAERVSAGVQDCRLGSTVQVPLITWGGDIPTILANGNQLKTAGGSLFADFDLNLELKREDRFAEQVEAYLSCETPFLRGTQGMINMAVDITQADPRTEMVAIYQHSFSNGGDALVVGSGINTPADLRGKTIAVQAYGPHVDYMAKVLTDSGVKISEVNIRWLENLTGDHSPVAALQAGDVDAAFVIIPDALMLTSDGGVGTGAEGSVSGAKILLSTRSASRIISDVYVVRKDFLKNNRQLVENFVHGLLVAEELARDAMKADDGQLITAAGKILLDDGSASADVKGLWADAETSGFRGNVTWSQDRTLRGWLALNNEIQTAFRDMGLITKAYNLDHAAWNYDVFKESLTDTGGVVTPRFDEAKLAAVINDRVAQGNNDEGTLFSFEIKFKPNQKTFPLDVYETDFRKVIEFASTYAGAVITVEGHADPLEYLHAIKEGKSRIVQNRIRQSAKTLSVNRAIEVRSAIIDMAGQNGVPMDTSQFATVGLGFNDPATGLCGNKPCAPKSEAEWYSNMRVVFRIQQIEAEADVFRPLN